MASDRIETFLKNSHPVVLLPAHLKEYIEQIVDKCPDEVSWVMEVKELDNYMYQIESVYIPPQKVHATTTEFEADDIISLMELEPEFDPAKWRGWGHSHVNMHTSPSTQDKDMMMEFSDSCDFFVGMIHNKSGEVFCWVVDNKRGIFFRNVTVQIESVYTKEVEELLKNRVKELKPQNSYLKKGYGKKTSGNKMSGNKTTSIGGTVTDTTGTTRFPGFMLQGYYMCFTKKVLPGKTTPVPGYEVEGVFFPQSEANTPMLAVLAYKEYLDFDEPTKTNNPLEQEAINVPPLSKLKVYDEIEDWLDLDTEHEMMDYIAKTYVLNN